MAGSAGNAGNAGTSGSAGTSGNGGSGGGGPTRAVLVSFVGKGTGEVRFEGGPAVTKSGPVQIPLGNTRVSARSDPGSVFREWVDGGACPSSPNADCTVTTPMTELRVRFEPHRPSCASYPAAGADVACGVKSYRPGRYDVGQSTIDLTGEIMAEYSAMLSAYALDVSEVTTRRYARFFLSTGSQSAVSVRYPSGDRLDIPGGDRTPGPGPDDNANTLTSDPPYDSVGEFPQNGVTWEQAQAFCAWDGGRLPTDMEWEAAAHAVGETYPWGNDPPTCALAAYGNPSGPCPGNVSGVPVRIATRPIQRGLYDMAGSLSEWVADGWEPGNPDPPPTVHTPTRCNLSGNDPLCLPGGTGHPIRGGDWLFTNASCGFHHPCLASSRRNHLHPGSRHTNIGFRCAYPAEAINITKIGSNLNFAVESVEADLACPSGTNTCVGGVARGQSVTLRITGGAPGLTVVWGDGCSNVPGLECTRRLDGPLFVTVSLM